MHRCEEVAYHEAGHAVISCHLGVKFERAEIEPDPYELDWSGCVYHGDREQPSRVVEAIILAAGMMAERKKFPHSQWRRGYGVRADGKVKIRERSADAEKIGAYARAAARLERHVVGFSAARKQHHFIGLAEARAEYLVNRFWPDIERVAKALARRGELTHKQIRRILGPISPIGLHNGSDLDMVQPSTSLVYGRPPEKCTDGVGDEWSRYDPDTEDGDPEYHGGDEHGNVSLFGEH